MRPLRLSAKNYRSFPSLELDLSDGCTAILGANGAGKSSLVNLIELCLFGSRSMSAYVTEGSENLGMYVSLWFEHAGHDYMIGRQWREAGTQTEFTQHTAGLESANLTRESQAETQALIEQTIGLTRETFRASSFLAQGDGAAFTEAQPRERKAILAQILGLEVWEDLRARASAERVGSQEGRTRLEGRLEVLREQMGDRDELEVQRTAALGLQHQFDRDLQETKEKIATGRLILEETAKAEAERRSTLEAMAALDQRIAQGRGRLARIDARLEELGEPSLMEDPGPRAAALAQELRAVQSAGERDRLLLQAREMVEKAGAMQKAEHATCDRCGQALEDEARETAVDSVLAEAVELRTRAEALPAAEGTFTEGTRRTPAEVEADLHEVEKDAMRYLNAQAAEGERSRLVSEQAEVRQEVGEAVDARDSLPVLSALPPSDSLGAEINRLERQKDEQEEQVRAQAACLARAEEALSRLETVAAEVAECETEAARLRTHEGLLLTAEQAFGRDGIPALIVETAAVPQLERTANEILGELGGDMLVELRTRRVTKAGDEREALDIIVSTPAGERPYETFSGGERTRLNLALRIALARLLATRRGAEIQLLAIDEPEFLDERGLEALADVLRSLVDDFEVVLLISHHEALKDAFDQYLEVRKDGDSSRIWTDTSVRG